MDKTKLHSRLIRSEVYRGLNSTQRSILNLLWAGADAPRETAAGVTLTCRRRIATIAEAEGCSTATVKRALTALELTGLVRRTRTGRSSLITIIMPGRDSSPVSHQIAHQCAIRRLTSEPSDSSPVSPPPSNMYLPSKPAPAEAPLNGAAAVIFEMLSGGEAPPDLRLDPRVARDLARLDHVTIEVVRYAIEKTATRDRLRNPAGFLVQEIRNPDMHAVYEAAKRREETERRRRLRAEQERRERAEAETAERMAAEERQRIDEALDGLSDERFDELLAGVMVEMDEYERAHFTRKTPEQRRGSSILRSLVGRMVLKAATNTERTDAI